MSSENLIEGPQWNNKPTKPGVYWCMDSKGSCEICRMAILEDGRVVTMFPGVGVAYELGTIKIDKWYGPLQLADFEACSISSSGFYKKIDPPVEPEAPKTRKRRTKKSKNE